jgi:hypothetical protein
MTQAEPSGDGNGDARTVLALERAGFAWVGAYAGSPERAAALRAQGFTWIAVTTDTGVLQPGGEAARAALARSS